MEKNLAEMFGKTLNLFLHSESTQILKASVALRFYTSIRDAKLNEI